MSELRKTRIPKPQLTSRTHLLRLKDLPFNLTSTKLPYFSVTPPQGPSTNMQNFSGHSSTMALKVSLKRIPDHSLETFLYS